MWNRRVAIILSIAVLLTSQQTSADDISLTPPTIDLPPELSRVLTDYETAWQSRDEHALAALFTPDGFVMSSGRPPAHGRAAITERYADSGGPLALRAYAFAVADSLGYIIGGYARQRGEPDSGKFTLTLRRAADDGRWLIVSDMDNGNARR